MSKIKSSLQNRKKFTIFIVITLLLIMGLVWNFKFKNTKYKGQEKSLVVLKTFEEKLVLASRIDATEKVDLQFQTGGKLAYVGVREGQTVKKNELVATLDQRQLELDLQKSLNSFLVSRWDFDQTKDDFKPAEAPGTLGTKWSRILDKSQFGLNNAILDVEIKSLVKQYGRLNSPIVGIVTKVSSPFPGVNISPASAIFSIVNPDTLFMSSDVDQNDLKQLREGMRGELKLDIDISKLIPVVVSSISFSPIEQDASTVYEVKIDFENKESLAGLRLGMTGDVDFVINNRSNVIAVESKYIHKDGDKNFLTVLGDNDVLVETPVKVGEINDGYTEIISGVKSGDSIVLVKTQ